MTKLPAQTNKLSILEIKPRYQPAIIASSTIKTKIKSIQFIKNVTHELNKKFAEIFTLVIFKIQK
jgi:hypothetical protein